MTLIGGIVCGANWRHFVGSRARCDEKKRRWELQDTIDGEDRGPYRILTNEVARAYRCLDGTPAIPELQ